MQKGDLVHICPEKQRIYLIKQLLKSVVSPGHVGEGTYYPLSPFHTSFHSFGHAIET
jgi:hypothetical protein